MLQPNHAAALILIIVLLQTEDYIQDKIIQEAKIRIFEDDKTVSENTFELGFKYPQHFSRLFK